jgi:para-nitrobenzyl esterase
MLPVVLTRQGALEGDIGPHEVCVFRGVPYARPPVDELRFRAPEPPSIWVGTRSARTFGPSAVQDARIMPDVGRCSEDSLFVNVWTPAVDHSKRPVMVWLHGGGFHFGSSAQEMYDGANLARRGNVVVVSLNYRLGALGFAYLRDLLGRHASRVDANNGLRDQIAALRWVKDNIEAFGGDPENVTLFGESAGAMSLGVLLAAPSARGLFRRAIAQSGAAHHALSLEHASQVAARFMRALGASAEQPEALWRSTPEAIVAAQHTCAAEVVELGPEGKRLPQTGVTLLPVVDGDVLPEYPLTAIQAGCANEVELLIGTNVDEWNYFLFLTDPKKRGIDDAELLKVCERRLPGHGSKAVELYRNTLGEQVPAWRIFTALETDRTFWAPALRLAEAQAQHNARTFMYLFDYTSPLFQAEMGSCHALEIPFVFGGLATPFGRAFAGESPVAHGLSQAMLSAWTGFARSGDPSHEGLGAWAPYESQVRHTMRLGEQRGLVSDPRPALRPFWDALR